MFSKLYHRIMRWSQHPHAPFYLAGLSISEAIFFPIPPDVMLAPMALSKPERAWYYATLTTLTSTLGGILGYFLGMFSFIALQPLIQAFGYEAAYLQVQHWFILWGFWAMFLSGFTPIPYKLFTIAAGAISMPFIPFLLGALAGRAARFYLVSAAMRWGGKPMERILLRCIEWVGWLTIIAVVAFCLWKFL